MDDDPQQPYRVCGACARRLRSFMLRPLEWFRLAAVHSPWKHHLRDEFYGSSVEDLGVALLPEKPMVVRTANLKPKVVAMKPVEQSRGG